MTRLWIVGLVTVWSASAAFNPAEWAWQCPAPTEGVAPGFIRLSLTPAVLDRSLPTRGDLRLIDGAQRLVPYVLDWVDTGPETRIEWRDVRLIGRTFEVGAYIRVVLDFGKAVEKNRVRLDLSEDDYCRRVMLDASPDNQTWETVLEEAWVCHVRQAATDFELDTVAFPVNTFRYLRLTVFTMPSDPPRIDVRRVQAALTRTRPAPDLLPVSLNAWTVTHDAERSQTVHVLDLGFRHLSIARIDLPVEDAYFYRGWELRGRNAATKRAPGYAEHGTVTREEPWRLIRRGVMYRIQDKGKVRESDPIEHLHAPYRYLELRIVDGDNPPLTLRQPIAVYRRDVGLVFDCDPAQTYTLCFGNPKAGTVHFDLAQAVRGLEEEALPRLVAGEVVPLAGEGPEQPWTERHPVLIWAALLVAVAAIVVLIGLNLKRLQPNPPSTD